MLGYSLRTAQDIEYKPSLIQYPTNSKEQTNLANQCQYVVYGRNS